MVNVKHMEDSKDVKLTEVPEGTILSNTLKLISNADGHIRQLAVDLLKEYITTSLSEQIQTINNFIGNLQLLSTSEKANVVGAINEINNSVSTNNLGVQQNTENISLLNSNLNTHMSYKVQRIGIRNYSINTDYPIQPLDIPRIGLVIPTYGSINTFSYNTLMFVVERDATTIKLQRMFKNDGSMVSSGNVDIDIILFPVW